MGNERTFRVNHVIPFLKTLKNTYSLPIQQVAIIGDPDFVLSIAGRFVALELKDDGEVPRKLQQHKLDQLARTGAKTLVACPENWEQVKQILTDLSEGKNLWQKK